MSNNSIRWSSNNTDPNNQPLIIGNTVYPSLQLNSTSYSSVSVTINDPMEGFYSKDDIKHILKKCVRKGKINEALLVMLTGSKNEKYKELATLILKTINE